MKTRRANTPSVHATINFTLLWWYCTHTHNFTHKCVLLILILFFFYMYNLRPLLRRGLGAGTRGFFFFLFL
jgi:hypothetical protein